MSGTPSERRAPPPQDCEEFCLEGPPASAWQTFDFEMHQQEQSQWCWAAVAASVACYYDPANPVSQCEVASGQLGRDDCCDSRKRNPCNVDGYLMSALEQVGYMRKWLVLKPATLRQVRTEADEARPLCARLLWAQRTGHFVAIVGYAEPEESESKKRESKKSRPKEDKPKKGAGIAIADPFWGVADLDHRDFPTLYAYGAVWTDTYFTSAEGGS